MKKPVMLWAAGMLLGAVVGYGTPLTGSGANLPLPGATGPVSPGIAPALTPGVGSFTAVWNATAPVAWQGTIAGTGNYPSSGATGLSSWNFSGVGAGYLPAGTYFRLGDVDQGSFESITLRAYDSTNSLITSDWLDVPSFLAGSTPAEFVGTNLPGYSVTAGVYTFTGASSNTLLTVTLPSNTDIYRLEVQKDETTNGFGLAAPDVPEPGTWVMLVCGMGLIGLGRKRTV